MVNWAKVVMGAGLMWLGLYLSVVGRILPGVFGLFGTLPFVLFGFTLIVGGLVGNVSSILGGD